jgi:hypothetical protein
MLYRVGTGSGVESPCMVIGPGVIEGAGDLSSVVGGLFASKVGGAGGGCDGE